MLSPSENGEYHQKWHRAFPGKPSEVREARRFVTTHLGEGPGVDSARLVVTELATNAIRHSQSGRLGGRFRVTLQTGDNLLLVTVMDEGGPLCPQVRKADDQRLSGRGLHLVAELTTRWGVHGDERGRRVWALLDFESAVTERGPTR
jgi:anti-sigma regulatory factor (Ser/Thr protein kinase)